MKPHRLHYAVVKEQQLYFKYEPVSIAGLKKAYKTHGVIRLLIYDGNDILISTR